ncbi:MAG TPA: DHH family phosphoesterase [Clostridia bacterium]|nr:DHH family phosphoesterase [Clostridia bacterium]
MKLKPQNALIPFAIVSFLVGAGLAAFANPWWYGALSLALLALGVGVSAIILGAYKKRLEREFDDIFKTNASASAQIMNTLTIPALLFDADGRIIWANKSFRQISDGRDIRRILPGFDARFPAQALSFEYSGSTYQVMSLPVKRDHPGAKSLIFQYWLDRTEALHYTRLYEENMPVVALIYVDNYEELAADKQFHRSSVLSEVENMVSELTTSLHGAYRRYETARFFLVFEAKYLPELEKQRFPLLEAAHAIETGTEQPVTLSVAVGAEERVSRSDESAREGMELALGRGGDQAVVKRGMGYMFYGGRKQVSSPKQSRVKTRLFAKALRQLMENSDQVFIMGHNYPDMDCVGAALGLMRCASCALKRSYYVLNEPNTMIDGALDAMAGSKQYHDSVVTEEHALQLIRPSSVIIVVDTQRTSSVLSTKLYESASKTVIIDHHRRPVDALANPTLNYLEAGASSTCEMVTEVLQYFDDDLKPTAFECSALLAGMSMDTKSFSINTGARTFEAAGFLRKCGADTSMIKLMYQDDMQNFRNRAQVVQNALIMDQGIAISTCPKDMPDGALIAAQAADALLSIKGIQASFVLAAANDSVMISGRSLGSINVQIILERIGGGGHLTVAGAQLHGVSLEEGVKTLMNSIHTYLKEAAIE